MRDDATSAQGRADLEACRALLNAGSRSFHAASLLLPRPVRDSATALYAFCRLADDAIDLAAAETEPERARPARADVARPRHDGTTQPEKPGTTQPEKTGAGRQEKPGAARPDRSGAELAALRTRLERIWCGDPAPIPADRALARVVSRHGIPRPLLEALLEGLAWDAAGRRYPTIEALHAYAARVAGTVGAVMALLMGVRDPRAVARACDLGIAMQLSNIARDLGEDARAGRLYLPLQWLREAGIDPDAWLARPEYSAAVAGVVRRLLREAELLYARADAGIAILPASCRPGIGAARRLYAAIGTEVARPGFDPVARRARVPGRLKLALVAAALPPRRADPAVLAAPPLPAARFLLDALGAAQPSPFGAAQPSPFGAAQPSPFSAAQPSRSTAEQAVCSPEVRRAGVRRGVEERALWLIALLERMQRDDAVRRGAS